MACQETVLPDLAISWLQPVSLNNRSSPTVQP